MRAFLTFVPALATLALAAPLSAQEVPDGSYWTGGGSDQTVTADIADTGYAGGNVTVQLNSASGFSSAVTGQAGPSCTGDNPTCNQSGTMTTPNGSQYRIRGRYVQHLVKPNPKKAGKWINMRKIKKPKASGLNHRHEHLEAGEAAPHRGRFVGEGRNVQELILEKGDLAPWSGWLFGDETTSLPMISDRYGHASLPN